MNEQAEQIELSEASQESEPIVTFGQLVLRRFLKNKMAIAGVVFLVFISLFCFVFSLQIFNPYREYEQFYEPDMSFTAEQLQFMEDHRLLPKDTQVKSVERIKTSAILDTWEDRVGELSPLKTALADAKPSALFRLSRVSFRLADKNVIVAEGFATNADIKLYSKQPPSAQHWLGTDRDGYDVFTRLQYGGRISLLVGLICMLFALLLGVTLGGVSGFYGGIVDGIIMRLVDIFNSIPTFPIIILMNSFMRAMSVNERSKIFYVMLALGIFAWPSIARLVRGQILSLREQEFMVATEAVGLRSGRRIFRHLLPNVMPQIIISATLMVGEVILLESALSFLGLGIAPPYSSWGVMINSVSDVLVMLNCPFIWIPPGVCILLTVMAINFVGDGLRDAFDPKMKR